MGWSDSEVIKIVWEVRGVVMVFESFCRFTMVFESFTQDLNTTSFSSKISIPLLPHHHSKLTVATAIIIKHL